MGSALSDILSGSKKAGEAFKDMGKAALKAITDFVAEQVIAHTIGAAMQAALTASLTAMGVTIANAWASAAAMVSLATLGGNAAPAAAGIASTHAVAQALAMPKAMALGGEGMVTRPTLFLAGEAGPERFKFEPVGQSEGRGGGGGDIYITIDNPQISTSEDISDLAVQLGIEMERQLRYGRGAV